MAEPLEEKHRHKESNQRLERSNPIHQEAIESKLKFRKERISKVLFDKRVGSSTHVQSYSKIEEEQDELLKPREKDTYRYTSTKGSFTPSTERKNRENAGTADPVTI